MPFPPNQFPSDSSFALAFYLYIEWQYYILYGANCIPNGELCKVCPNVCLPPQNKSCDWVDESVSGIFGEQTHTNKQ